MTTLRLLMRIVTCFHAELSLQSAVANVVAVDKCPIVYVR